MPGKNTTHAILSLVDYLINSLKNNKLTCGIFLDISKAFDTIDHNILLFYSMTLPSITFTKINIHLHSITLQIWYKMKYAELFHELLIQSLSICINK